MNTPDILRGAFAFAFAIAWIVPFASLVSACSKSSCDYENPRCDDGHICAFVQQGKSHCIPYADLALEIQPPFRKEHQFWCSQGGRSATGRTHSFKGDLLALDLVSTSTGDNVEVVSPVSGTAYTFDECAERDSGANARNNSRCGLGYGNHVKVWDGENIYLFGHLARVLVRPGPVQRDDVLGLMGCSGAAGPRHVHFSVTRPAAGDDVEKLLSTPGSWGPVPVRYRMLARNAATNETVVGWPDTIPCVDEQARATVLAR